jgi:4-aminobutyrate aminotransferase/(S)-3-amino-2-methylpropionate transaminase
VLDADDNQYVDLVAGFGALVLGHCPDVLQKALCDQASQLWLALGDVYSTEVKLSLCEQLAARFPEPGARVMLGSSGADAITAALKTAVLATGSPRVIAFTGSYHGLSYGPLAACGLNDAFRIPFAAQLSDHVRFLPYPDTERALDEVLAALRHEPFGAILIEPILGRGGCVVPPPETLCALRQACDEHKALLIVDEIWTGLGRCGAWFDSVDQGVLPDVVCIGKALGGGFPISACMGRGRVMEAWGVQGGATLHTATHFGAPLGCAVALAVLRAIDEQGLVARARQLGLQWTLALRERLDGSRCGVREVRGRGLMVGIELHGGASRTLAVMRALLTRGYLVLTGGVAGDVLTLTPALDIEESLLLGFAEVLEQVLVACPC